MKCDFYSFLKKEHPEYMPLYQWDNINLAKEIPIGTTVVAIKYKHGVIMAGDRRAVTQDHKIAHGKIKKVYKVDRYSVVGISGVTDPAIQLVDIFRRDLNVYRRNEGRSLSLEGQANRLSLLIKGNLSAAAQGFVVLPMIAGYDTESRQGRIWEIGIGGVAYEKELFNAIGSGKDHADGVLEQYFDKCSVEEATKEIGVKLLIRSLEKAAGKDATTGVINPVKGIYPNISLVTKMGTEEIKDEQIEEIYKEYLKGGI